MQPYEKNPAKNTFGSRCFGTRSRKGTLHGFLTKCYTFSPFQSVWLFVLILTVVLVFIYLGFGTSVLSRVSRAGLPNRRGGTAYAARLLALLLHLPPATLALALLLLTFWSLVFAF